jgi:hypothetical protein
VKSLADKTYLVQHKTPNGSSQRIKAAADEVHGKYLAFVSSEGKLAALFLLENVKSWNVAPDGQDDLKGLCGFCG